MIAGETSRAYDEVRDLETNRRRFVCNGLLYWNYLDCDNFACYVPRGGHRSVSGAFGAARYSSRERSHHIDGISSFE